MTQTQEGKTGVHLFGEKSKIANWILSHQLHIAAGGVLIYCICFVGKNGKLTTSGMVVPAVFFGLFLLLRFVCRNLCYWVEIEPAAGKIKFFRCFNKGVVEAPLSSVEFVFDKHFACLYRGERFTIFNEYMYGIAEILPPGVEIHFSCGVYGRFIRKQFEKRGAKGGSH
jgi:hypothetical protein